MLQLDVQARYSVKEKTIFRGTERTINRYENRSKIFDAFMVARQLYLGDLDPLAVDTAIWNYLARLSPDSETATTLYDEFVTRQLIYPQDMNMVMLPFHGTIMTQERNALLYTYTAAGEQGGLMTVPMRIGTHLAFDAIIRLAPPATPFSERIRLSIKQRIDYLSRRGYSMSRDQYQTATYIPVVRKILKTRRMLELITFNLLRHDINSPKVDKMDVKISPFEAEYENRFTAYTSTMSKKLWKRVMRESAVDLLREIGHPYNNVVADDIIDAYTKGLMSETPLDYWIDFYLRSAEPSATKTAGMFSEAHLVSPKAIIHLWPTRYENVLDYNNTKLGDPLWYYQPKKLPQNSLVYGSGLINYFRYGRFDANHIAENNKGVSEGVTSLKGAKDHKPLDNRFSTIGPRSEFPQVTILNRPLLIPQEFQSEIGRLMTATIDQRPTVLALSKTAIPAAQGDSTTRKDIYVLVLPDTFMQTRVTPIVKQHLTVEPIKETGSTISGTALRDTKLEAWLTKERGFLRTKTEEFGPQDWALNQIFGG